jgi:hypothetical protein
MRIRAHNGTPMGLRQVTQVRSRWTLRESSEIRAGRQGQGRTGTGTYRDRDVQGQGQGQDEVGTETNEKEHYAELQFAIRSKEKRHLGTQVRSWTLLNGYNASHAPGSGPTRRRRDCKFLSATVGHGVRLT